MGTDIFHTTVTERNSFRTCRRAWHLGAIERLSPRRGRQFYFMFGDMVHAALEAYYKYDRNLGVAIEVLKAEWENHDAQLREEFDYEFTQELADEWYAEWEKASTMLIYYDKYDKGHPFFDRVVDMSIEERSFIPILDLDGKPIQDAYLSGRIDMVVEREDGVWVVDHKTLSSPPSDSALDIDDQITGYCYIYYRMTGVIPRGGMYNVLIKDPPKPPRLLKNGTLSKDKSQRTTYDLYCIEIENQGLVGQIAEYTEILDYLRDKGWSQFYLRMQSERNIEQLAEFERHLYHEFVDMQDSLTFPGARYPNPSQYTCPRCQYLPICKAMEEGSDPDFIKKNGYQVLEPRHKLPEELA